MISMMSSGDMGREHTSLGEGIRGSVCGIAGSIGNGSENTLSFALGIISTAACLVGKFLSGGFGFS